MKRARGMIAKKEHESIDVYEFCPCKTKLYIKENCIADHASTIGSIIVS